MPRASLGAWVCSEERESLGFGENSLCGASAGSRADCGPHGPLGATPALCSGAGGGDPGALVLPRAEEGARRGRKVARCCGAGADGPRL